MALKLTQKYRSPEQGAHQTTITNTYLNEVEYEVLAPLAGYELAKRRYSYVYEGVRYSLDVFEGDLKGLILAEIEATVGQSIRGMALPGFALMEVTDEAFFTGGELAKTGKEELRERLSAVLGT